MGTKKFRTHGTSNKYTGTKNRDFCPKKLVSTYVL